METDNFLLDDSFDNILSQADLAAIDQIFNTVDVNFSLGLDIDTVTEALAKTKDEDISTKSEPTGRFANLESDDLDVLANANSEKSTLYQHDGH